MPVISILWAALGVPFITVQQQIVMNKHTWLFYSSLHVLWKMQIMQPRWALWCSGFCLGFFFGFFSLVCLVGISFFILYLSPPFQKQHVSYVCRMNSPCLEDFCFRGKNSLSLTLIYVSFLCTALSSACIGDN